MAEKDPSIASSSRGGDVDGHICRPTVLFADIEGSTPLASEFSDDVTAALLGQRLRTLGFEIVDAYGCEHREFRGDEVMACFGVRTAVEAAPLRACRAAWEIHRRMQDEVVFFDERFGVRPRLRIGVNTGTALYWESENDDGDRELYVHGDALNLCKRIESVTEPGRIFIGYETYQAVREFVDAPSVGEFYLKGVTEPQSLYRLDGVRDGVSRFDERRTRGLTRLLERSKELGELTALVEESARSGLMVVEVVGEPGIGKSRLVYELERSLDQKRATVFMGHCRIDGRNAPFHPFVEVLRHRNGFNILDSDDDDTARAKLERALVDVLDLDPERHIPYLMNLLGRGTDETAIGDYAEVVGAETRNTLTRLLTHRASVSPVVLVIEDLHWIDTTSEQLLRTIAKSSTDLPVLVLCTFRLREYQSNWGDSVPARRIKLAPLTGEGTTALIRQRLRVDELPQDLVDYVIDMSDGNPLFAEEIMSYLVDTGQLSTVDGVVTLRDEHLRPGLPEKPREIFEQRLGRLDPDTRWVVEAASAVGRQFPESLLGEVTGLGAAVSEQLATLVNHEIVRLTDRAQRQFTFKHSLIQEAAYGGLTRTRREQLHAAVGDALARFYQGREGEVADVLAYHYGQAFDLARARPNLRDGSHRPNPHSSNALRYLKMAGEKSLRVYSAEDAHEHFQRAISITNEQLELAEPDTVASLVLSLARIHYFRGDVARAVSLLERHLEVANDSPALLPSYMAELGYGYVYSLRSKDAARILTTAERLATESNDLRALGRAKMGLVWHCVFCIPPDREQRRQVEILGREADALGERTGDAWLRITAKFAMAQDAVMHANPRRVRRLTDELLELHEEHDDVRAKSLASIVLAEMHALNMNYDEAIAHAEAARKFAVTEIDQFNIRCAEGVAAAMAERGPEAVRILGPTREELRHRGVKLAQILIDMPFGVARIAVGELSAGARIIRGAIDEFNDWGYSMGQCNGHSYLGEVYTRVALREGTLGFTEAVKNIGFIATAVPFASRRARYHLRRAVACNRHSDAPSYVAWAYLNLGRLDLSKKRVRSARSHLERARDIAASVDAYALCSAATLGLGELAELESNLIDAWERYQCARELAVRAGAHALAARTLFHLAQVAGRTNRTEEARSLYAKSREIAQELGTRSGAALVEAIDGELEGLA